jgi:hypothetical protein
MTAPINWDPPPRVLRQFAAAWLLALGFVAWRLGFPHEPGALNVALAILAVTVGPLGLAWPRVVRWPFVGLSLATWPIGWLVSRLVLAALFYGVFAPFGLVFRLAGRDALALRRRPDRDSHWRPREQAAEPGRYFRQF